MTHRVLVHGGVDSGDGASMTRGLEAAAAAGRDVLARGGDALSAVEISIRVLEDDPLFNAGIGSVLNQDGEVETDAGVADGTVGRFAGVAALPDVRNPISVATELLRRSPGPVLLVGAGARRFAAQLGASLGELRTVEQLSSWGEAKSGGHTTTSPFTGRLGAVDTVGAIALDTLGRIAAGSSTGGIQLKMPGRVGDSAVFGAGIYADADRAVLCSGLGEAAIELSLALRVGMRCEMGSDPDEAVTWAVARLDERGARGGVMLYDRVADRISVAHNATSFPVVTTDGNDLPLVSRATLGGTRGG